MYALQSAKLPRVFESLPDSVGAELIIMKPEFQSKAVVEPDEKDS